MFYSLDMIERMGYKYIADFVSYIVKVYRYNCSIQYANNGVYVYSDFDSMCGYENIGREAKTYERNR